MSLWVHLNIRPTCLIVDNLSSTSVLQYTTTNHASDRIVSTINFVKPDYIGTVSEYENVSILYDNVLVSQ